MTVLTLLLAASLSAGNAEFDATAREGARDIAIGRVRAALVEKGPAPGALAKAMLADPARFHAPAKAEELCRAVFADAVRAQFDEKVRAIDERLGNASAGNRAELAPDEISARHFARMFAAERKAAVDEQARSIVGATRPPEAEFDAKEDWELRESMLARVLERQKAPVFAENRKYVAERLVEPVLQDARREQRRQADYLQHARCGAFAPSKLADELKAALAEDVARRRAAAEDPSKAWGVFEGTVGKSLGGAVERRSVARLATRLDRAAIDVSPESVEKIMAEDPSRHVKATDSEKLFKERYSADLVAGALDGVCADAPEGEREELREYLSRRLGAEDIRRSVDARLEKDVLAKWRAVRAALAERQSAETWPSLAEGTWYPESSLADDVAARSDYAGTVRAWRDLPGMKDLAAAAQGKSLLEEAAALADVQVAAAFDLSRTAIVAQNSIVDSCHAAVLAESRRRKDSFWSRTPDLKAVVSLLTEATVAKWNASRLETLWPGDAKRPANADGQHKELFPSVKRKIELLAKVILEEMNEPRPETEEKPEEKPPEEKPPEETPPEETPPEEEPPEEELLEFTISIRRTGDEIEVALKSGEAAEESSTVPAKKDDFENAMYRITGALSRLLKLK